MGIQYIINKNISNTEQLDELWKAIPWKPRGKKKWLEVLSKSAVVCSAWDGTKLVGFGRIVEDGIMCMFYDIGIHPKYQKRGIGTNIMKILIDFVKNKNYASIGLFAWEQNKKNNMKFYREFGFVNVDSGMELVKYMERE